MSIQQIKSGVIADSAISKEKTNFLDTTGSLDIAVGTTAQRPGSPTTGKIRFNSTLLAYEMYGGSRWEVMATGQARIRDYNPSTVTSTTNTTFRNMWTFTHSIDSNEPKIISVGFTGWNNAGAYYWGWRLYNSTRAAVIPLLNVSCLPRNYLSIDGGIQHHGNVHQASAQPFIVFDMSGETSGDTIALQMTNTTDSGGSNPIASTQQLNAKSFKVFNGIVTGPSGTDYFGT